MTRIKKAHIHRNLFGATAAAADETLDAFFNPKNASEMNATTIIAFRQLKKSTSSRATDIV